MDGNCDLVRTIHIITRTSLFHLIGSISDYSSGLLFGAPAIGDLW